MRKSVAIVVCLLAAPLIGQTEPPFVTALRAPVEVAFTPQKNLIIVEAGVTPNGGRISLVDRTSGARRTLVDGLPSAFFNGTTPPSPAGPSSIYLQGSTLYVTIGSGDETIAGPVPSSELPNPAGPTSPIFSSVLSMRPSRSLDTIKGDFVLQPSQHATLKSGATVTLTNTANEELTVRLVADFPDYAASPRPDLPQNVKNSNAFGVVSLGNTLYVVDASLDLLRRVNVTDGTFATFATFAQLTNPTPVGPPKIDYVPDSIRIRGNDLLITNLTGFPFPDGLGEVRSIDINTGLSQTILSGLTSAIDVVSLGDAASSPLLVLEFSRNMLAGSPGRLRLFTPGQAPVVITDTLITPTGMAVDRTTGEVFITHIGPGLVTRVRAAGLIPAAPPTAVIAGVASTSGAHGSQWVTSAQISNPYSFPISGRVVFHPQGASAQTGDPSLAYVLALFETKSYTDLVAAAGGSGLGSADVISSVGGAPAAVIRVTDQASENKPSVQIPLVDPTQALTAGVRGTLITPADVSMTRFNIGIRTLDQGVTMMVTLYSEGGAVVKTNTMAFPSNYFVQMPVNDLIGGVAGSNSAISFSVTGGSALIYGSGADNNGRNITLQFATPTSEM